MTLILEGSSSSERLVYAQNKMKRVRETDNLCSSLNFCGGIAILKETNMQDPAIPIFFIDTRLGVWIKVIINEKH